jgi:hypothetical protein
MTRTFTSIVRHRFVTSPDSKPNRDAEYTSFENWLEEIQAKAAKDENERIIELLSSIPFRWDGNTQAVTLDKREIIKLIEGEPDE